jgi:predicted 3-demethylubiquinone-9 3-methyltransferase (glyoxalase superfamily)
MQKITPFLWFDTEAEEAAKFYTSIFKDAKINTVERYPEGSPAPAGSVMTVSFKLYGQDFIALNAGPLYKFTEAISFVINCESQEEIDHYWNNLLKGGTPQACGWLKDKYGLSWQVVPAILPKLFSSKDPEKSKRVMEAMMKMVKFDIKALEEAYEGEVVS